MIKNLSVAAILGCFLVAGYGGWAKCNAQEVDKTDPAPQEDPGARKAADALAQQLGAPSAEVRQSAATALEAMGPRAGKALGNYISAELNGETQRESAVTRMQGITKAASILGKIGKGIAEDKQVREALWSAAESKVKLAERSQQYEWPKLQMRLAAIEALGKINEYRSGIFGNELDTSELVQAKVACDASDASGALEKIAGELFKELANDRSASPPPPRGVPPDKEFYSNFSVLYDSQTKLIKSAAQVKIAVLLSKTTTEPILSKLTDASELERSVRKIYSGYLKATKKDESAKSNADNSKKGKEQTDADNADGAPAAYDMLTEARQLKDQLQSLCKEMRTLEKDRVELSALISALGTISEAAHEKSEFEHKTAAVETSNSDLIAAEAAKALNRIFSKRPAEKPAADATKKDAAKKDTAKKDTAKKDTAKDDTAKKDTAEEE
jgi:cell fate (sporulation/competence/biofilm development) regulator YlbF (YheA/YmcA/DUF963 family)